MDIDPLEVVPHDLLASVALQGHAQRSDLAHAHAMAPAGAGQRNAFGQAVGVTFDVDSERAAVQELLMQSVADFVLIGKLDGMALPHGVQVLEIEGDGSPG